MKSHIIIAGHKIVNDQIVINLTCDEITWTDAEEKFAKISSHVAEIKKRLADNKLVFHSESVTFIDCNGKEG